MANERPVADHDIKYGANFGLATYPNKLKSSVVKRILERALWEQGLRRPLAKGQKRHEWKAPQLRIGYPTYVKIRHN
jgi:hypothetical protein